MTSSEKTTLWHFWPWALRLLDDVKVGWVKHSVVACNEGSKGEKN